MIDFINSKIMTTVNYVMMILHSVNYVTIVYTHSEMAPRETINSVVPRYVEKPWKTVE